MSYNLKCLGSEADSESKKRRKVDPVPLPHFVLAFPSLGLRALFSRGTAATANPGTNINGAKAALIHKRILQAQQRQLITMGNVVDAIQVLVAFLVKHVLPLGSHYFDGIRSKENFA